MPTSTLSRLCAALLLALGLAGSAAAQSSAPPPRALGAIGFLVQALNDGDTARIGELSRMAGPTGSVLAVWEHLRAGGSTRLADYATFLERYPDWPALDQLRRRAESVAETAAPPQVLAFFDLHPPLTTEGKFAHLMALEGTGARDQAALLAQSLWAGETLSAAQENALLARYGDALAPLNAARLDMLLWRGADAGAERMLARVPAGPAAVARARLALQARAEGVNPLIAAVPESLRDDPGLWLDRTTWRIHSGLLDEAAVSMRDRSVSAAALGRPQAWAAARQRLVRRAMAEGNHTLAYDLARLHWLDDGVAQVELEFLAGYIAYRHLNRPADALPHFRALRERASSPITLGRSGYWEGRALEALGRTEEARAAFAEGARHQTAFYGQLAAERLGLPLDPALVTPPSYPDIAQTALAGSVVLEAATLLHRRGEWHEARRFAMHLARAYTDEPTLGALADFWLARGEPNFAVNIAKIAVQSGIILPRANFPLTGLEQLELAAPADLVMAIARRESEFDAAVVSSADARGLMQVLPGTGALVARRLGLEFDPASLTTDPALNAILGAAYLDELSREFGGALPLIAAGYNAGPGRPRRWITEFGDPRDASVDPVFWVETIPFAETRNYVMRVLESLVIYRALLTGRTEITLSEMLRGR
jgi:soluble lytic murein transglycosylase